MTSVDDILKSMLDEMKKYQIEYDEATKQVNTIIKEYSAKIDDLQKQRLALQDEGNKKIDILNARREQLSGKHSSLYEQYKKFAGKDPEFEEDKSKISDDNKKEDVKKAEKVVNKKISNKVAEPKKDDKTAPNKEKSNGLSQEELQKLAEITTETEKSTDIKPNVDKNGNEIPEYLQDAYKK